MIKKVIKLDKLDPARISDGFCPFTGTLCCYDQCDHFVKYSKQEDGVVYCHCDHDGTFDYLDCMYLHVSYNTHELSDTCRFTPDIKLGSLACKECLSFCGIVKLGTDFFVRCLK